MVNGKEVILDAVLVRNLPRFQWDLTRKSVFNMVLLPQKLCFWMYIIYIYTHMYVCNCIYICMYVCMHVCNYVCMYVCIPYAPWCWNIYLHLGHLGGKCWQIYHTWSIGVYIYTHSRWILRYLSKHRILSWFGLILPLKAKDLSTKGSNQGLPSTALPKRRAIRNLPLI